MTVLWAVRAALPARSAGMMCSALQNVMCRWRDVHFVHDVCLRHVIAEHIASLYGFAVKHHYAARHNFICAARRKLHF